MLNQISEVDYEVSVFDISAPESNDVEIINDVLADCSDKCLNGIINRVNDLFKQISHSDQTVSFFEAYLFKYRAAVPGMLELKFVYNDMVAAYMADTSPDRNSSFTADLQALASMVRQSTKDMSPVDRAGFVKAVSMFSGGDNPLRKDGGSNFAMAVLPEEFMLMLDEHFAKIRYAGAELICMGELVDGIRYDFSSSMEAKGRAISVKEELEGSFVVRNNNGRWYATEEIKDLVSVPAYGDTAVFRIHRADCLRHDELTAYIGQTGYVTANSIDRDTLNFDGVTFKVQVAQGDMMFTQSLDYKQVVITKITRAIAKTVSGEKKESLIVFAKVTGEQDRPAAPEPVVLLSAKQQKQQGGLF